MTIHQVFQFELALKQTSRQVICVQGIYLEAPRMPTEGTGENEVRKEEKPIAHSVMTPML